MTDKEILLDHEKAIAQNMDPLGNQYTITVSHKYTGLYTIVPKNAHPNKEVPVELRGHWTNVDRAARALMNHLITMWDKVEQKKKPLARAGKKEEASAAQA